MNIILYLIITLIACTLIYLVSYTEHFKLLALSIFVITIILLIILDSTIIT